jgi:hypothetical protein
MTGISIIGGGIARLVAVTEALDVLRASERTPTEASIHAVA